jgi:DNA mismatch repair protein MutS
MSTPMRGQYLAIKKQFPDVILFFRLGDFYETFDDDARIVSQVCDVVLTSRPVGDDQRVPLAGVPYHAIDTYLSRLVSAGYKVAIAEQIGTEPPKGEKIVARVVRRVVTPGTIVEPGLLADGRNNYVAAVAWGGEDGAIAYADITTGEFAVTQFPHGPEAWLRAGDELARLAPAEVIFPHVEPHRFERARAAEALPIPFPSGCALSPYPAWRFDADTARQALLDHFEVSTLAGFGCDNLPGAVRAAGGLLQYLAETQRDHLPQIGSMRTYSTSEFMTLDESTRRSLELTESVRGDGSKGTLLAVMDVTRTPMGARLLRRWLRQPLVEIAPLNLRLDGVAGWLNDTLGRADLRKLLSGCGDLERWTNRAVQGIAVPRDLVGLRSALARSAELAPLIIAHNRGQAFDSCDDARELLERGLVQDPPATLNGMGIIRSGYSAELDGIHLTSREAREWMAGLEARERQRTGIRSLKVGFNKVFGYYIEVTQSNQALVPPDYERRQTLVNAERFVTSEMKSYETLILNAEHDVQELESQLFRGLLAEIGAASDRLLRLAGQIAEHDVLAALAEVAAENRYVRPELADDLLLDIRAGRHPVVERTLSDERFVPNDLHLSSDGALVLLTGPNMAGKSTYIRQVALIVLMAQIGSFVPAEYAHIGIVDRIFTRVGASDEIARGQSTFMVEMVETANILHHATERSLLILDEIGRGTSTYDGLAIAWAIVEYLHNHPRLRSRTLFATHYHELTDLAERLPHVRNFNVAVAEQGDDVVFLHRIAPGAADRSYGVHVAQMAGLPRQVVTRAQEILVELEASGAAGPRRSVAPPMLHQLTLFSTDDPVLTELRALDVNALSPLDALNKLFELQQRLKQA